MSAGTLGESSLPLLLQQRSGSQLEIEQAAELRQAGYLEIFREFMWMGWALPWAYVGIFYKASSGHACMHSNLMITVAPSFSPPRPH